MATDNVALTRRFIEQVWNKGELGVLGDILSPKIKSHDPMMGDREGIAAGEEYVRAFRAAFPDFQLTIDDIGTVADKVFVRWTATGTHRGDLLGIPATGRRGVVHGISINRFENGKLAEVWYAWDSYSLFQQMGLLPAFDKLPKQKAATTAAAK